MAISHLHGLHPPYDLVDGIVYFHDWRYVAQGEIVWEDEQGNRPPLMSLDPQRPVRFGTADMPVGIKIVPQKATKSEPVITVEQSKEPFLGVFGGTLLRDGGVYRFWYFGRTRASLEADTVAGRTGRGDYIASAPVAWKSYVRYAESDDGVNWRFPHVGLHEDDNGDKDNNIVFDRGWGRVYGPGNVFIDQSAPPNERYKMVYMDAVDDHGLEEFRRERPDAVDPGAIVPGGAYALCGAVSPDGLSWTALPAPLLLQFTDTTQVCEYDPIRRTYVAYIRSWLFNRRTIGRCETGDFGRFPLPQELFWPDPTMEPHEIWYSNAKTRMPGTQTYHLMLPVCWNLLKDRFEVRLAASPDNVVWNLLPAEPVLEVGQPGTWDSGTVWSCQELVELPDQRLGMLYGGSPVPHKHPRVPPLGSVAWASWPKGRLVALHASELGSFSLWPLKVKGSNVYLNFKTPITGFIEVEVSDEEGQPVAGRSFDDCDRMTGDELDRQVTWHGETDIGMPEHGPVQLRFRMASADLFSVRFG